MADEKSKIVTDATGPDAGPAPVQPEAGGGTPAPKQEQPTPEAVFPDKATAPEQAATAQPEKGADAPKEQKAASVSVFNFSEIMAEKRPLAYITAAWCGDPDTDMEIAARYCRMAYEAGFSPICPILYLPLFINDAIPEEHKNGIDMRRDMLRRSHVLVVCGGEVDEDVKNDIAVAKRLNITATTLDGILTVNQQGRHDV